MMNRKQWIATIGLLTTSPISMGLEMTGYVAPTLRYFYETPRETQQHKPYLSASSEVEFYHGFETAELVVKPFARVEQYNTNRTHWDIREAWLYNDFDFMRIQVGLSKVFWGVAESNHLVDIINQTDTLEGVDGEDKLGQPLISLAKSFEKGDVTIFMMPYFRERQAENRIGRLYANPPIDRSYTTYQSSSKKKHFDWAVRYFHTFDDYDVGIAHFVGTSRAPDLVPGFDNNANLVLKPHYPLIKQTSLDFQATKDAWLWKLEMITQKRAHQRHFAAVGGFEYTLVGVFESDADVGLLSEYSFDDRKALSPSPLNRDLFLGTRIAMNDEDSSELLGGVIIDTGTKAQSYLLEASRRWKENWKISCEFHLSTNLPAQDPLYAFRRDSHVELELKYYF